MIVRSHFGPFGIAVANNQRTPGYTAWACHGDTVADNAAFEPADDVWFQFGSSAEEAMDRLKTELRAMLN
jgi:hypothetical protein